MKKIKSNSGFTLIEIIVSLAIMALIITAVCGLMSFNTLTYKKTKADLQVQTSAQETYDKIADAIMQAEEVTLVGYTCDDEITYDSYEIGKKLTGVNFNDEKTYKIASKILPTDSDIISFESLKIVDPTDSSKRLYTKVYPKELTIVYNVPFDSSVANATAGVNVGTVSETVKYDIKDASGTVTETSETVEYYKFNDPEDLSKVVKIVKKGATDQCTVKYIFEDDCIYISTSYRYMKSLNVTYDGSESSKKACLYSDSLNYATLENGTAPGVIFTVDAENNSIGMDLIFADKSMAYTTNGMINIRNSYVLKDFE